MSKSQIPIKTPEEMGGKVNVENGSPKIVKKVMHKKDISDENSGQGRNSPKPSRIDMTQVVEGHEIGSKAPINETILLTDIHPNDWNPNQMSIEEHIELVAEIRHLGHVPKPIVLRRIETGYEIVDGEQAYQALIKLGWKELQPGQYEFIEADDFEAMRQTYKRNQHGTHDKLKEGLLFKRLMDERKLSQRELAKQVDISEGTIRNALEYVKALEVRNNYAEWDLYSYKEKLANLSVRDVRKLNEMPVEMGNLWLNAGAKPEELSGIDGDANYEPKLAALIPMLGVQTCSAAEDQLRKIGEALHLWGYSRIVSGKHGRERIWIGGLFLEVEEAIPYLKCYLQSRWFKKWSSSTAYFIRILLEQISRPDGEKAKIVLPLDTFQVWIDNPDPMSFIDFIKKLKEATSEVDAPINGTDLWRDQLQKYAPAEIKNSNLPVEQAYKLWQAFKASEADGVKKEFLDQALEQVILTIGPNSRPDEILDSKIRELIGEAEIEAEVTSLGDKATMLELVKGEILQEAQIYAFFGSQRNSQKISSAMQPMLDRLATLQEPELALVAAMFIHKPNYLRIWMTAIGRKFENNVEHKEAEIIIGKSKHATSRVKH